MVAGRRTGTTGPAGTAPPGGGVGVAGVAPPTGTGSAADRIAQDAERQALRLAKRMRYGGPLNHAPGLSFGENVAEGFVEAGQRIKRPFVTQTWTPKNAGAIENRAVQLVAAVLNDTMEVDEAIEQFGRLRGKAGKKIYTKADKAVTSALRGLYSQLDAAEWDQALGRKTRNGRDPDELAYRIWRLEQAQDAFLDLKDDIEVTKYGPQNRVSDRAGGAPQKPVRDESKYHIYTRERFPAAAQTNDTVALAASELAWQLRSQYIALEAAGKKDTAKAKALKQQQNAWTRYACEMASDTLLADWDQQEWSGAVQGRDQDIRSGSPVTVARPKSAADVSDLHIPLADEMKANSVDILGRANEDYSLKTFLTEGRTYAAGSPLSIALEEAETAIIEDILKDENLLLITDDADHVTLVGGRPTLSKNSAEKINAVIKALVDDGNSKSSNPVFGRDDAVSLILDITNTIGTSRFDMSKSDRDVLMQDLFDPKGALVYGLAPAPAPPGPAPTGVGHATTATGSPALAVVGGKGGGSLAP